MFTIPHLIWLGILGMLIAAALIVLTRIRADHSRVSLVTMAVLVALKLVHISLSMKESEFGGMVIDQNQLSFHLCSIQIYFIIVINFIKNQKAVKAIKSFIVPCAVIGAAMSLLIPTEGVDPATPRVWQYMLIHAVLIFYGFYLMLVEKVDLGAHVYLRNLEFLLIVVAVAFLMNSVLEQYETNFLFLRTPPMEGLPLLNLDNGWYLYFVALASAAVILLTLVHLPFLFERKGKKEKN